MYIRIPYIPALANYKRGIYCAFFSCAARDSLHRETYLYPPLPELNRISLTAMQRDVVYMLARQHITHKCAI